MEMTTKYSELSLMFEKGKIVTNANMDLIRENALDNYDRYIAYTNDVHDVRVIKNINQFSLLADYDRNVIEEVVKSIFKRFERSEIRRISSLYCYMRGLEDRGIHILLMTSGKIYAVKDPDKVPPTAYSTTTDESLLTENYDEIGINTRVYEVIANAQGVNSELRIGNVDACYCARKMLNDFFPHISTVMYVAGKEVTLYAVPEFGLPKMTQNSFTKKSRISSSVRELLSDTYDMDFLHRLENQIGNFTHNGTPLKGQFFYDYRGRIYWQGNINYQGSQENRELEVDGEECWEYDATCSGIQLGSILSNNTKMMKKCNVIATDGGKQDAYHFIASQTCTTYGYGDHFGLKDEVYHITDEELKENKDGSWESPFKVARTICKKPLMLLPYGAAAQTLIGSSYAVAREYYTDASATVHVFSETQAKELSKAIYATVMKEINREATYKVILDNFINVETLVVDGKEKGQYASWVTPDGLHVNSYSKIAIRSINSMDKDNLLHLMKTATLELQLGETLCKKTVYYTSGANIKFFKNDVPNVGQLVPNFIHSLDATALRYVSSKLFDQGIPVAVIHDCVIVPKKVTQEMISTLFREAYQFIADYFNVDVKIDGMIVFPE